MTKGYLNGWLTFEYKTQWSKAREEFLISTVERVEMVDILKTKTGLYSTLTSGLPSEEQIDNTFSVFKDYMHLNLPYLVENSTIKTSKKPASIKELGELLKKAKLDKLRQDALSTPGKK